MIESSFVKLHKQLPMHIRIKSIEKSKDLDKDISPERFFYKAVWSWELGVECTQLTAGGRRRSKDGVHYQPHSTSG